jgi:transcriptional regulator GlxA family with amidase domain
MDIAFLLYENMTPLDLIGPYQVLSMMPGARCHLVSDTRGPIGTDAGIRMIAEETLAEVPSPDVIVVPGSKDPSGAIRNPVMISWLSRAHETTKWTTSVCTGALILGAAGVLRGRRATTHWLTQGPLESFGATSVEDRVVIDGKVITAAGVSSGIDMALRLVALERGDTVAQAIQLAIEYAPEPPFNAGSPRTASAEVVAMVKQMFGAPPGGA